jgi:hypothetical protein
MLAEAAQDRYKSKSPILWMFRVFARDMAFLRNHREAIAAMDFFTVPILTFGVLYCFFVIGHDRRKILHCNVTRQPDALWIVLQLREAWGYEPPKRF